MMTKIKLTIDIIMPCRHITNIWIYKEEGRVNLFFYSQIFFDAIDERIIHNFNSKYHLSFFSPVTGFSQIFDKTLACLG
ncbi:Uncharacterised protein [Mycobacterium tuberculosis]|nr:Uncharacterised protein [Mycobacterium tuberculosis]